MIRKNVAEILNDHVTFELEAIDRMYLNAYVPSLQTGGGFVYFVKTQLGARVPSTVMVAPMSERFVEAIERFVATQGIDLVTFEKGQRKDDVAQQYLATFDGRGRACSSSARPRRRPASSAPRNDATPHGKTYPWIIRSTAMLNHYYFYILDRDFGPLFIKFCSYFPYPAKLCLNGHEWLKRQLTQRGIAFEPLDNGIRSSDEAGPRATDRRHAGRRQDRRGLSQMAPALAASVRPRAPRGRLSLSALDPAERVRADPGPRSAAAPAAVSSKRSSARISTSAVPIRCN